MVGGSLAEHGVLPLRTWSQRLKPYAFVLVLAMALAGADVYRLEPFVYYERKAS